jgi:protease IV
MPRTIRLLAALPLLSLFLSPPIVRAEDEKEKKDEHASAQAIAHLKLSGDLGDRPTPDVPFGRPPLTYRGFLDVLRKAQADSDVAAVFVELKDPQLGFTKVAETREALRQLRSSGKKVYLYAEELTGPGAVLAASADKVAMPEGGMVLMPAVSAEVVYLKGLFEVIGVDWLVFQEKEYKTALESFIRDKMSPELREVLDGILDQRYESIVGAIAAGRKLPPERVKETIDEGILSASRAKELGLIDLVQYRDEFEAAMSKEVGEEAAIRRDYGRAKSELDLSNPFALFSQIAKALGGPERRHDASPKIAIVYAEGIITSGKSQSSPFGGGGGTMGSETLVKAIDEAAGDASVKAIVLRVDSPGGSGLASDVIWRALMRAREKKPVVASMSELAASGGYYISMAAQVIVAEPETLTGSIGVIAARPSLRRLLGFWAVRTERLQRGKNAGLLDVLSDPDEPELKALKAFTSGFYKEFVAKVARSRNLPEEEVERVARGRVWTGLQAKERKLVDELGGLDKAIEIAKKRAGLAAEARVRLAEYPEPPDFFEALGDLFETRASTRGPGGLDLEAVLRLAGGRPESTAALGLLAALPEARDLLGRVWQLALLSREPALAILPFELRSR